MAGAERGHSVFRLTVLPAGQRIQTTDRTPTHTHLQATAAPIFVFVSSSGHGENGLIFFDAVVLLSVHLPFIGRSQYFGACQSQEITWLSKCACEVHKMLKVLSLMWGLQ